MNNFSYISTFFTFTSFMICASETDDLYQQAIAAFNQTTTVNASVNRYQMYKGVTRESSGTLQYDRTLGAVYQYTSPSRFQINCTDSIICSINPEKRKGFRFTITPNRPLRYCDLDPFHRFFPLFSSLDSLSFMGSVDSLSIYTKKNSSTQTPEISIGIDRNLKCVTLIEFFDFAGHLFQQVLFTYKENRLPETIATKTKLGDALLIDSLVLYYEKSDKRLQPDLFLIPQGITWSNNP